MTRIYSESYTLTRRQEGQTSQHARSGSAVNGNLFIGNHHENHEYLSKSAEICEIPSYMCWGGGYLRSGTRHSCATSSAAGGVGEVMSLVAMIWRGAKSVGVMVTLSINV